MNITELINKIPIYIQRVNEYLTNLPTIIKNSPADEQYAWYAIGGGVCLIFIQMMLWIIF